MDSLPELVKNHCATCEAETERIVNNLVRELAEAKAAHEQEIEEWRHNQDMCFASAEASDREIKRLMAEVEQLQNSQQLSALSHAQQYLLDLCAQMGDNWRHRFDTLPDGIQEIIRASDKVQGIVSDPKTGQIVESRESVPA